MLYPFLKVLVGFVLKVFFRKIHISGAHLIDSNKAQIIASNHPNGFMEPLIMACYFPKDLHFLVRGDVFDNPLLKPMLIATHQIPIFRFRDGFSKMRENNQTVDSSIKILSQLKTLLIFAEGGTKSIKMLRPLQKGLSRIAFQTIGQYPELPLEIVPVGINFTNPTQFRSDVMLRVGEPISVKQYFDLAQNKEAHENLLQTVYEAMYQNIIHVSNQNRMPTIDKILEMYRSVQPEPLLPVLNQDITQLDHEKQIAEQVDLMEETRFEMTKSEVKEFIKSLKDLKLSVDDLKKKKSSFSNWIFLIFGFIPALLGVLINFIPVSLGYWFTKSNVTQKEFRSSILMVSSMVLFLIYYIIIIISTLFQMLPWYIIFIGFSTGLFLIYYMDTLNHIYFKADFNKLEVAKIKRDSILQNLNFNHN